MLTRMQCGCLSSFGEYRGSFGYENSCSRVLGVSNFNSNLAQGVSTLISSCIAMYLELACHFKVIVDGHTHTDIQTDNLNTIVL